MSVFRNILCFCLLAFSCCVVVSCSKEEGQTGSPSLSLSVSMVAVGAEGGAVSVVYSVVNPVGDGAVSAAADVDWLSGFDTSALGVVEFAALENVSTEGREGTFTLSYVWSGGSSSVSLRVVQDGVVSPSLLLSDYSLTASSRGGSYSFGYTVLNALSDGGELSCKTDVSWLSRLDWSEEGVVSFNVDENSGEERSGSIVLDYSSSAGTVEARLTVSQNGSDEIYLSDVVGTYTATALVHGDNYSYQTVSWQLKIFESGEAGYDLCIDEWLMPFIGENGGRVGDHRTGALAMYRDGKIVVPSQCSDVITITSASFKTYYLGYTPCTSFDGTNFQYDTSFPDLVFSGDWKTGEWESDYGLFLCGCGNPGDITSFAVYFQVAAPTITLVRTSTDTE